ncbi:hypothetical protein IU449_22075 [Nocardia higoensis]|uniref:Secreted protein n=1 Tax=Nocardia higoensis TaxID=228599 RepID=A0ABS0DH67_9NOCA|nr:hypothetical protein [Nocardia higoensis]MBF6357198.1 hypothetical protein [Nocardia higoensis]
MEILLAVLLPIVILASCLVVIRVVRQKQRSGALGNMAPTTNGDSVIPVDDSAQDVSVEHHVDAVSRSTGPGEEGLQVGH